MLSSFTSPFLQRKFRIQLMLVAEPPLITSHIVIRHRPDENLTRQDSIHDIALLRLPCYVTLDAELSDILSALSNCGDI